MRYARLQSKKASRAVQTRKIVQRGTYCEGAARRCELCRSFFMLTTERCIENASAPSRSARWKSRACQDGARRDGRAVGGVLGGGGGGGGARAGLGGRRARGAQARLALRKYLRHSSGSMVKTEVKALVRSEAIL